MNISIEDIKKALLTYIESLSPYEISKFLQFHKMLVDDALYYMENTPVSVQGDLETEKKITQLFSEAEILETAKKLSKTYGL